MYDTTGPRRTARWRTVVEVGLVVVLGLAVTLATASWVRGREAAERAAAQRIALERATTVIDRRMEYYTAALRGLGGLVAASEEVTRAEFAAYVRSTEILKRYPGVQALQLTRAVDDADVPAFEQAVRDAGHPDFEVHPASDAPTRYVIDYVEPMAGNEAAFGLDLGATPERLATVEQARDTGTEVASTGITLIQTGDRGFILLSAVYEDGWTPTTVAARRRAFRGAVNGVFRLRDVLDGLLPAGISSRIEVYDGGAVGEPVAEHRRATLLYDSDRRLRAPSTVADPAELGRLQVGGRRWLVHVDPTPATGVGARVGLLATAAGIALTLALAALVLSLSRSRERAEGIAQRRTAELARRAQELQEARDEALAADRAKSEFLSNMSHELRTPLNGILGTYELLEAPGTDPERRAHYLALGRRSATELLAIVNDILDLSRIEAGGLDLAREAFDPAALVTEVAGRMRVLTADKGLDLRTEIAPDVGDRVVGDPLRVRQVLVNLVGNAVKFTAEGSVTLAVSRADERRLRFAVHDTGIGIEPDDLDRIFRSFEQVDLSTTRRYGGTGLGLAIVARLVALMGGTVGVDSTPGQGSTFHCTVELPPAVPTSPASPEPAGAPAGT